VLKDRYDRVEFGTIKYMATSGGISCPEADARIAYYGISGYPTAVFGGTDQVVGAGVESADGSTYDPVVQSMLDDATPVKMAITGYSFGFPAFVQVDLELTDDIADITNTYVRVFINENELFYSPRTYQDVMRDCMPDQALTISQAGQTQTVYLPIDMGGFTYENVDNLWIAAIVQRDSDKMILQSCNSYPAPDYSFRYYALGERVQIGSGTVQFGEFALFNTGGLADSYDLNLDTSDLPAMWNAYISDGQNQYQNLNVALNPGESASYWVVIETHPDSPGGGRADLSIHSVNARTGDRSLGYSVITSDTQILLVDDDGAFDYESHYYAPALATTGRSFAIWDRGAASLTADILSNFDAVVWGTAFAFPTFDAADRAALAAYLDGGGALFATGQDIGWDLNDQGAMPWYHTYLGANYIADDTNYLYLTGVDGDPIGDGISLHIAGGDGANNQDYPSDIDPYNAESSVVLRYDANRNGGVKTDRGTFRSVYFSFGFEAIDNATDRQLVMERVIDWLLPDQTDAGEGAPVASAALRQNVPNPFNPKTEISYSLSTAGPVELAVYDFDGRLVCVLENGVREAGSHSVTWDGVDANGHSVASGLYFYRLHSAGQELTRKMMLIK